MPVRVRARMRAFAAIMKLYFVFVVSLLGTMPVQCFPAQDAAVEAREGEIDHWIEYYRKQRSQSDETVTENAAPRKTESPDSGDAGPGEAAARPVAPPPDD